MWKPRWCVSTDEGIYLALWSSLPTNTNVSTSSVIIFVSWDPASLIGVWSYIFLVFTHSKWMEGAKDLIRRSIFADCTCLVTDHGTLFREILPQLYLIRPRRYDNCEMLVLFPDCTFIITRKNWPSQRQCSASVVIPYRYSAIVSFWKEYHVYLM